MKENVFFKVGYSPFLENKKEKWTSKVFKKIIEHKFLTIVLAIVAMCVITNLCLIYKFIYLMENLKKWNSFFLKRLFHFS